MFKQETDHKTGLNKGASQSVSFHAVGLPKSLYCSMKTSANPCPVSLPSLPPTRLLLETPESLPSCHVPNILFKVSPPSPAWRKQPLLYICRCSLWAGTPYNQNYRKGFLLQPQPNLQMPTLVPMPVIFGQWVQDMGRAFFLVRLTWNCELIFEE